MKIKHETPCELMARLSKLMEHEFENKKRRIGKLMERLNKLKSQPNPDKTQIRKIRADIKELKDQLETDLLQLDAFKKEFKASCGS